MLRLSITAIPLVIGLAAYAQNRGPLEIELNTLEPVDSACRLTFTVRNPTAHDIDRAVFETVLFDADGAVAAFTLFDFEDVPAGRLRVRRFDLPQLDCARLGAFLLNAAETCSVGGTASEVCDGARATSRAPVEALQ